MQTGEDARVYKLLRQIIGQSRILTRLASSFREISQEDLICFQIKKAFTILGEANALLFKKNVHLQTRKFRVPAYNRKAEHSPCHVCIIEYKEYPSEIHVGPYSALLYCKWKLPSMLRQSLESIYSYSYFLVFTPMNHKTNLHLSDSPKIQGHPAKTKNPSPLNSITSVATYGSTTWPPSPRPAAAARIEIRHAITGQATRASVKIARARKLRMYTHAHVHRETHIGGTKAR